MKQLQKALENPTFEPFCDSLGLSGQDLEPISKLFELLSMKQLQKALENPTSEPLCDSFGQSGQDLEPLHFVH